VTRKNLSKKATSPSTTRALPNPLAVPATQLGSAPSSSTASLPAQLHGSGSSSPVWAPNHRAVMATTAAATALPEEVPSSATWARADPARRPFFSPRATTTTKTTTTSRPNPYRNTHADSGPAATNPYLPLSRKGMNDTVPAARAVEDEVLRPLRGVLEYYWNNTDAAHAASKQSTSAILRQKLLQLAVPPLAGLLWMSESHRCGMEGDTRFSPTPDSDSMNASVASVWERLVKDVECSSAVANAVAGARSSLPSSETRAVSTFVHVQTRLPPIATVAVPLQRSHLQDHPGTHGDTRDAGRGSVAACEVDRETFLCRMAGGVEPVVPFAVGQPLPGPASTRSASSPSDIFSHISCLTRVHLQVSLPKVAAAPTPPRRSGEEASRPASSNAKTSPPAPLQAEPWKLGDDGLDLMVPQHVRTVAECHPAKSLRRDTRSPAAPSRPDSAGLAAGGGHFVLGRMDAETYLLPQRELLLTLYVPTRTEDMCAAQNNDRLQRQVRAGRASRSAMAWSTDQTRLTSARRALGQYANAESAGRTGTSLNSSSSSPSSSALSSSGETPPFATLTSRTSYEVRALPGDVVYIPRGWGYEVQRILGMATIHIGRGGYHDTAAAGPTAPHDFRDNRQLGSSFRGPPRRPITSAEPPHSTELAQEGEECEKLGGGVNNGSGIAASTHITSIEVDALCLHYCPYPELTAEQAAVYVAANYVHTGVEEFYEKGGNQVFRSYE
jgi:hypothetical protein